MRGRTTPKVAETLALNVLGFLANSPETLERLMEQTGLDLSMIRKQAANRHFLAAILDFLLANEELLVEFCQTAQIDPKEVHLAGYALGAE